MHVCVCADITVIFHPVLAGVCLGEVIASAGEGHQEEGPLLCPTELDLAALSQSMRSVVLHKVQPN